jgi:hypothetical protein
MENISRKALEQFQDIVRQYVRRRQGVYALYRRGTLYYVGLASNLRGRLASHLRDRHGSSWDRFSVYLTIGDSHLRELESLVLRIMRPVGNKQKGRFAKSLDIRRRFAKDIRAHHRNELNMLLGRTAARPSLARPGSSGPGRAPSLAKYRIGPTVLRARFKGKNLTARVRRDGSVRFRGKVFRSPSLAGVAAVKRPCNGWTFWSYQRAPGDWVVLDTLRR